jgi:hypothetical protein
MQTNPLQFKKKLKIFSAQCSLISAKRIDGLKGSQARCLSGKNSFKMKTSMVRWWNDIDRRK